MPTAGKRKAEQVNVKRLKKFSIRYESSDSEDEVPSSTKKVVTFEDRTDKPMEEDNDRTIESDDEATII